MVVVVVVVWVALVVTGGLVIDWADEVVEEAELLVIIISEVDTVAGEELLIEVSP